MDTVFLLEDDPQLIQLLELELGDRGYRVAPVRAEELFRRIEQARPAAVIMESDLIKEDGLDLLQLIRNRYNDLPVLLWSASSRRRHDPRTMAADYFLLKESNIDNLIDKLGRAVESGLTPSSKLRSGLGAGRLH